MEKKMFGIKGWVQCHWMCLCFNFKWCKTLHSHSFSFLSNITNLNELVHQDPICVVSHYFWTLSNMSFCVLCSLLLGNVFKKRHDSWCDIVTHLFAWLQPYFSLGFTCPDSIFQFVFDLCISCFYFWLFPSCCQLLVVCGMDFVLE